MKALCWYGTGDVRVEDVSEPKILNPRDAVVRITLSAICGSDLQLYNGYIPTMKKGDILGHEFMGEIVEVGKDVTTLKKADRVVVPCTISCGGCFFCKQQLWSLCDNSNPNAWMAEKVHGDAGGGQYGSSHLHGGYAGGQAQYARVPFADVGCLKIGDELSDEQVLFLSDVFPTGWQAAEQCSIQPGDTVAVWGCGPVGQFAIRSAYLLGAGRVIAIDRFPQRLSMAQQGGAETLNDEQDRDVVRCLKDMTGGRGPDACIDAVGMEAHSAGVSAVYDYAKRKAQRETNRPSAFRQAIEACRKGGTVSVSGVYGGFMDKFPIGAAFAKGLAFRLGQTHVPRYMRPLLERIERGDIDPSFVVTHRVNLEEGPQAYRNLRDGKEWIKVVLRPN